MNRVRSRHGLGGRLVTPQMADSAQLDHKSLLKRSVTLPTFHFAIFSRCSSFHLALIAGVNTQNFKPFSGIFSPMALHVDVTSIPNSFPAQPDAKSSSNK